MNARVRREYARLRGIGWRASEAYHAAKTTERFADAGDLVRLRAVEDSEPYQCGDAEDAEYVNDVIARHGVWGFVAEYRLTDEDEWQEADSVWGILGNDLEDNPYEADLQNAALDALDAARAEAASALASRATFAG